MQIRMEKVRLSSTDIKRVYFEAFPEKERMPFPLMVAMSKLWNTQFFGFYDDDVPCGFMYLASIGKIVFVMFFAVDKRLRSKGYGSSILQQLKNEYPDKTEGVVQEIIITNGTFVKREFRSFFAIYSNGIMWPKIWEQQRNHVIG